MWVIIPFLDEKNFQKFLKFGKLRVSFACLRNWFGKLKFSLHFFRLSRHQCHPAFCTLFLKKRNIWPIEKNVKEIIYIFKIENVIKGISCKVIC